MCGYYGGGGYYNGGGYYGGGDYGPTVVVSSRDREHYQGYGYNSGYYDRERGFIISRHKWESEDNRRAH